MTRRSYLLGLTGSIGMGKSTTARFLADAGVPVWDADGAVHRLYGPGMQGAVAIADLAPHVVTSGGVDRDLLRLAILSDPELLGRVEARIHPLVAADRASFVELHEAAALVVLDIPLLYETGADAWLDGVLLVTAPAEVQRKRVLARPGMTAEMLERILERQIPDAEKRARADFIIDTDKGREAAREAALDLAQRLTTQGGARCAK